MRLLRRLTAPVSVLQPDDTIIGRSEAFILPPGSPLRGAPCLICQQAAGGHPVTVFAIYQFIIRAHKCGAFPAAAWLIHDDHPPVAESRLAGLAIARHQYCITEEI